MELQKRPNVDRASKGQRNRYGRYTKENKNNLRSAHKGVSFHCIIRWLVLEGCVFIHTYERFLIIRFFQDGLLVRNGQKMWVKS